jgi:hypothetical protein
MKELNNRIRAMWWILAAMFFFGFGLSNWLNFYKPTDLDWAAFLGLIGVGLLWEGIRDGVSALIEHQDAIREAVTPDHSEQYLSRILEKVSDLNSTVDSIWVELQSRNWPNPENPEVQDPPNSK